MVAVNHNYFNFDVDYFTPSFEKSSSLLNTAKRYMSVLRGLYSLNKFLQTSIYNVENFLLLTGADSVEKIDDILIKLEDFTDLSQETLEENEQLKKWYNYPLRYMVDKVETSNMSLQAMLASQQAHLMHQSKHDHWENPTLLQNR